MNPNREIRDGLLTLRDTAKGLAKRATSNEVRAYWDGQAKHFQQAIDVRSRMIELQTKGKANG